MKKSINVGLIGCGTVGRGVAKILLRQQKLISDRAGHKIILKKVADLKFHTIDGFSIPAALRTSDAFGLINDPEIDVVVEVIGGVKPAKDFILGALRNGKHVVTSNKEVIAKHGPEFFRVAQENNVNLFYEASVGGGIPIIHALKKCLSANEIKEIYGIVNGTTNYILTKMSTEGRDFQDVLAEAQKLGYAEADPTADVDGYDAAYKLSILAYTAFHQYIPYQQIAFEGIRKISARDIELARQFGYVIKLIAMGRQNDGTLELKVSPMMIPVDHPLASVQNAFNAIFVVGDAVGETMFYGRGAGELPTASAVVGDIVDLAMHAEESSAEPMLLDYGRKKVLPAGDAVSQFFIRLSVLDRSGVLAAISSAFGKFNVSIKTVSQQDAVKGAAELVIVTHKVQEKAFMAAMKKIEKLNTVKKVDSVIRVGLDD